MKKFTELERKTLYKLSHDTFGRENEIMKCIEECAELIQVLACYHSNRSKIEWLISEIADVEITVEQLKQIYNISEKDIVKYKNLKLTRFSSILRKELKKRADEKSDMSSL